MPRHQSTFGDSPSMTDRSRPSILHATRLSMTRRQTLGGSAALLALAGIGRADAQETADAAQPFSYEWLAERMKKIASEPYADPQTVEGGFGELDYDDYRQIQFDPDKARWAGGSKFVLHAYPLGWLFDVPVTLHEIVDGKAVPLDFTTDDFLYHNDLKERVPEHAELPGVAGFRLNAPLNTPDLLDEVVSFLGASYFRALGKGNVYGLSARGLAVNTATGSDEEFPRFSDFWLERPPPGAEQVVLYAALQSRSVTGAYRFVVVPGETTRIDVTARLYFREAVNQFGIAPLTSMFLFGPSDPGPFNDYRRSVHDSEALVLTSGGQSFFRPLNNPDRLANSYIGVDGLASFGLVQRGRAFDDYLDAHALYQRRPSLTVEPVGNWGKGTVRLIEIPSDLEANDNIVAFWVPQAEVAPGDALEFNYRLYWGDNPPGSRPDVAQVVRTLVGDGGVGGVEPDRDRRKFVVDFAGGPLAELKDADEVTPRVTASSGEVTQAVLERLEAEGIWRLVIEVSAPAESVVEVRADLLRDDNRLSETWLYQWVKS